MGYENIRDNVIREFIRLSARRASIFSGFLSLNWIESLKVAIEEVKIKERFTEKFAICYTGNILDKSRKKYDLEYYVRKAKELESLGVDILGIKDMSGLLKPMADLADWWKALKENVKIPFIFILTDSTEMLWQLCLWRQRQEWILQVLCDKALSPGLQA